MLESQIDNMIDVLSLLAGIIALTAGINTAIDYAKAVHHAPEELKELQACLKVILSNPYSPLLLPTSGAEFCTASGANPRFRQCDKRD